MRPSRRRLNCRVLQSHAASAVCLSLARSAARSSRSWASLPWRWSSVLTERAYRPGCPGASSGCPGASIRVRGGRLCNLQSRQPAQDPFPAPGSGAGARQPPSGHRFGHPRDSVALAPFSRGLSCKPRQGPWDARHPPGCVPKAALMDCPQIGLYGAAKASWLSSVGLSALIVASWRWSSAGSTNSEGSELPRSEAAGWLAG